MESTGLLRMWKRLLQVFVMELLQMALYGWQADNHSLMKLLLPIQRMESTGLLRMYQAYLHFLY